MRKIVVIGEYMEGREPPLNRELMACASRLSAPEGRDITVFYLKSESGGTTAGSEIARRILTPLLKEMAPGYVILGHTSRGIDLAPGLAIGLGASCVTGIHDIRFSEDGKPGFVKSFFKGKVDGIVETGDDEPAVCTLLTVEPGSFSQRISPGPGSGGGAWDGAWIDGQGHDGTTIIEKEITAPGECPMPNIYYGNVSHIMEGRMTDKPDHARGSHGNEDQGRGSHGNEDNGQGCNATGDQGRMGPKLKDARVIIAAGLGIGSPENLHDVYKLASCFANGTVAGSRPLIDMGWMPYEKQVGITGASVSPDLYMALGISGSSQHVPGMVQSRFIVSVNRDPRAAIFAVSDICVVEDAPDFIKVLCDSLLK
ncbi:MAG: electron transfer flavoprotein subunit alpha/FixB family protein [Desulfamplus sp.]|nr:electron transfer flavoprotein subunit alpha/FixB family protein [Desulfamplus sp.]